VAEFLARQREAAGQIELPLARPDALLFNGGALEPEAVRTRLGDVIATWHDGRRPAVLEGVSLQLAVARGAAYFGLVRRGLGVRIGGGAARTYYLGLGEGRALCLVPRGMEEGEALTLAEPEFELLPISPSPSALTATDRAAVPERDRHGETHRAASHPDGPPLRAGLVESALPVQLGYACIGTLRLVPLARQDHRWRLEFACASRWASRLRRGDSRA
jgi:hypothetical protein